MEWRKLLFLIGSWGVLWGSAPTYWKMSAKHFRVGASYDTLDHTLSTSASLRIEFPSLYTKEEQERPNWKGNSYWESSSLRLGIPFLRWHRGVLVGVKNRLEVTKGLTPSSRGNFSSQLVVTGTQREEQSYWENGVGVEGVRNRLNYFWNLDSKWFYWGDIWEFSTSITFSDREFPELKSGAGLSYSTGDHLLQYRLYLFREFPGKVVERVGGVLFGYPTKKPVIYGYKLYTQLKGEPYPHLHLIATPYLLYSKEYNFKLKPALSVSIYYQY